MAQLHFTLDQDFLVGLFSESKEDAFAKLMKVLLDQILQAESAQQLGADAYERTEDRSDYRNGTRTRSLVTRIGKIDLEVPRHRNVPFKTQLFENYQRNEQALIATMMEMVVQGISTRKVQKVTEELCGTPFSKSTVSEICKELDRSVLQFKERLLPVKYPFIIADAIYFKVREDHRIHSKAFFYAIGINGNGHKEILGFDIYSAENPTNWKDFFSKLKSRGLQGVDLVISDAHQGLVQSIKECFPDSSWQRCQVHLMRNILDKCPKRYQEGLSCELKDMFNASTLKEARKLKESICEEYGEIAQEAVNILDDGFEDSMTVMALPSKYRVSLRTSNVIERANRELRRREGVIQIFPNEASMIRLMGAVLMDLHNEWSLGNRLFDMQAYFNVYLSIQQALHTQVA